MTVGACRGFDRPAESPPVWLGWIFGTARVMLTLSKAGDISRRSTSGSWFLSRTGSFRVQRMPDPRPRPMIDPDRGDGRSLRGRRAPRGFDHLESRVLLSSGPLDPDLGTPSDLRPPAFFSAALPGESPPPGPAISARPAWSVVEVFERGPDREEFLAQIAEGLPAINFDHLAIAGAPIEAGRAEIFDQLTPGQLLKLYQLSVQPGTTSIRVDIHNPETAASIHGASRVVVFGEDGSVIFQLPMPRPGNDLSLRMTRPESNDRAPIGSLFLAIAREPVASDAIAPPASYPVAAFAITIQQGDRAQLAPTVIGSSRATTVNIILAPPCWVPTPGFGYDDFCDDFSGDGGVPSAPTELGQAAVGPLPLRSSGPLGGDSASAPQAGLLDGAIVDLALLDVSPDVEATAVTECLGPLSAIASPDGFPLLGSSRLLMARGDDGGIGFNLASAESTSEPTLDASSPKVATDATLDRHHPPFAVGLGVLAVVTTGLMVPDIVATFAPRFVRRPLPWEGKSRRRRRYFGPGGALGS